MTHHARIGMLTPSSNTVLEPECSAIVAHSNCTVHFSRFPVVAISVDDDHTSQFDLTPMLEAARLLAHARCDVIAWNGTSAGWLGVQKDRQLCAAITRATGIPAISTTQALLRIVDEWEWNTIGLVVPYEEPVVEAIQRTFSEEGLKVGHEQHANLRVNREFALLDSDQITAMIRSVAVDVDGVVVFCTNMAGAPLVETLEPRGVPILDSVSLTVWACLQSVGWTEPIHGWGRLLRENPPFQGVWEGLKSRTNKRL